MNSHTPDYHGSRFPPEIISHAIYAMRRAIHLEFNFREGG
jgi:hypothetical protein